MSKWAAESCVCARVCRSVAALVAAVEAHGGVLDVLVNNAGIAYKGDTFGAEEARVTLGVNLHGTHAVTEALLPHLRRSSEPRVVKCVAHGVRCKGPQPPQPVLMSSCLRGPMGG